MTWSERSRWPGLGDHDAVESVATIAWRVHFEERLQHIFVPNLRKAALSDTYASRSGVAVAAVRNLDGVEGSEHLIGLLSRVDDAIERS
jgi:hypothetical protein